MTTVTMPSYPAFTNSQFFLETNTQRFESPLSKTVQRVLLGGARWKAMLSLPAMNRDNAARWQAFFLACAGSTNTFNVYDPDCPTPRGPAGGTPLVAGGSQTGITLNIDGCTPSALFLKAGDYFGWTGGELKMATADATADGSGNVTLNFMPAIRTSPTDNVTIITTRPTCAMILADDMQAAWDCDKNGIYQPKSFAASEVFS